MARTKKNTTNNNSKAINKSIKEEESIDTSNNTKQNTKYVPKPQYLIPNDEIPFRSRPVIHNKYIVTNATVGKRYLIKSSIQSIIFGTFYLLDNGYYVHAGSNYTITER